MPANWTRRTVIDRGSRSDRTALSHSYALDYFSPFSSLPSFTRWIRQFFHIRVAFAVPSCSSYTSLFPFHRLSRTPFFLPNSFPSLSLPFPACVGWGGYVARWRSCSGSALFTPTVSSLHFSTLSCIRHFVYFRFTSSCIERIIFMVYFVVWLNLNSFRLAR